jgi:hypothetical protein
MEGTTGVQSLRDHFLMIPEDAFGDGIGPTVIPTTSSHQIGQLVETMLRARR